MQAGQLIAAGTVTTFTGHHPAGRASKLTDDRRYRARSG